MNIFKKSIIDNFEATNIISENENHIILHPDAVGDL